MQKYLPIICRAFFLFLFVIPINIHAQQLDFEGSRIVNIHNSSEITQEFSINLWLKPNSENAGTVISQIDSENSFSVGKTNQNRICVNVNNEQILSNTTLPLNQWHRISIVYQQNNMSVYIDGVFDISKPLTGAKLLAGDFLLGAKKSLQSANTSFINASIDELQIWNIALTQNQIRFMMNQEIEENAGYVQGKITRNISKNETSRLFWNALRYYSSMDIVNNMLVDNSAYGNNASVNFLPNSQTAPLPYLSNDDGLWEKPTSWANGQVQQQPNMISIVDNATSIDWNIVQTNSDLLSLSNRTILSLTVEGGEFAMGNDTKLFITHYLKIDGKIDLRGKSQLVQNINSEFDANSNGKLQRSQKGTSNVYNYNYWSSPVGSVNNSLNNSTYSVASVFKDGTNPLNPQEITWTTALNGSNTSPITLSNYWIFKFQNLNPSYSNWTAIGEDGELSAGQGFTLKGSGSTQEFQNYTFIGKPNNGDIAVPIAGNNINLSGNPYASSLNADQFVRDNLDSTTGIIYYWEHLDNNNSHYLVDYQGGYAARTLVGGVPAISLSGISSKVPARFIPVGQGFFLKGTTTGGLIKYNNGQRSFVKETNAASTAMFRQDNSNYSQAGYDNADDDVSADEFAKIRIGFDTSDNHHRSILLGFMDDFATDGIDRGYDALMMDNQVSDMYFFTSSNRLVIQGVGYFDASKAYKIGVKVNVDGVVKIGIDGTENFDNARQLFIYDNVTNVYTNLRNGSLEVALTAGTYNDRFSLRFADGNLSINQFATTATTIQFVSTTKQLKVVSNDENLTSIQIYNTLGQIVLSFSADDIIPTNIYNLQGLRNGVYIVKASSLDKCFSQKIMLQ